jgi:hypothetical protein
MAMLSEAKKYHAYARECLQMSESTDSADTRQALIELAHVWMEAALREEGVLKAASKAHHKT